MQRPTNHGSGASTEPDSQHSSMDNRYLSPSLSSSSKTPSDPDPTSCSDVSSLDDFELVDDPDQLPSVEHHSVGTDNSESQDDGDYGLDGSTFSRLEPDWRDNANASRFLSDSESRLNVGSSTPLGPLYPVSSFSSFHMAESELHQGSTDLPESQSPETDSISNSFRFPDPEASAKGSESHVTVDDDDAEANRSDTASSILALAESPQVSSSDAAEAHPDLSKAAMQETEKFPFQHDGVGTYLRTAVGLAFYLAVLLLPMIYVDRLAIGSSLVDVPSNFSATSVVTITASPSATAINNRSKKVKASLESTTVYSYLPEVPFNKPFQKSLDHTSRSDNASPSQITDLLPYQSLDFFELSSSFYYRAPRAASMVMNIRQSDPQIGARIHDILATLQKSWQQWVVELRKVFVTALDVVSRVATNEYAKIRKDLLVVSRVATNEYVKIREDLMGAKASVQHQWWNKVAKASEGLYRVTSSTCKSLSTSDTKKRLRDVKRLRDKHRAMLKSLDGTLQANLELKFMATVLRAESAKSEAVKTIKGLLNKCAAASEGRAHHARKARNHRQKKMSAHSLQKKHPHRKRMNTHT